MAHIGVLGAGTWGIALARMLSNTGSQVTVWSALETEINELSRTRLHPNLPGVNIPQELCFTKDIRQACQGQDLVLFAVSSPFVRTVAGRAAPYLSSGQLLVDAAKGIEPQTLLFMTEVIRDELDRAGGPENVRIAALSGPTHAEEVARDMPTTIVSASHNPDAARQVQDVFMNTCMRVYTNGDIRGVELCGAVKNIIALASGISRGLGYGDNTKAAIITRGLAEITRLGCAMGCAEQTFTGLAGIGDLIVTATSIHSRNNRCGEWIGQGMSTEEAVKKVGMVVEGIHAIPAARTLAEKYGIEMPIVEAVDAIINHGVRPAEAVKELMGREKKGERIQPLTLPRPEAHPAHEKNHGWTKQPECDMMGADLRKD